MGFLPSLPEFLASLQQFRPYLLLGAAILVLIGLAGGARLRVKDLELGPVEWPARIGALLLGLGCLAIVWGMPLPESDLVSVSGSMDFTPENIKNDIKIQLVPKYAVYETGIQEPGRNIATFQFTKKLEKGDYTLFIVEGNEISAKQDVSVSDARQILITKVPAEDGAVSQFTINQVRLLDDMFIRYRTAERWIEKAKVISILASNARHNESLKNELTTLINDDTQSIDDKELSIFAMSELGNSQTRPLLKKIVVNEQKNIYIRLRSAGYLSHTFNDREAETFLFRNLFDETPGIRIAASVNLSRGATNKACVIHQLIQGLKHSDPYVRDRVRESLIRSTGQSFGADESQKWAEWWSSRSLGAFEPCPSDQSGLMHASEGRKAKNGQQQ
jgi:hypothetical protein